MARMPGAWWRAERRQWYTRMKGRQIPLGVKDEQDEAAAWAALRQLIQGAVADAVPSKTGTLRAGTLSELVKGFLDSKRDLVEPRTLRGYGQHLKWFAGAFGKLTAQSLDIGELVGRAARVKSWGETHRANVLATVAQLLRWAGRVEPVPLPPKASRGAEAVISDEVYARVLDATYGDFRQLNRFLWETGCRPGEATALTVADVGWDVGTIRVKVHKTRRKGKTRIIYLGDEAMAILRFQSDKHGGEGLLFRGTRGRLTLRAMAGRFLTLSEKVGTTVTSYMYRHTWATRALKAGVPAAQVAEMLGHSSVAMVSKHYGHLSGEVDLLRAQANRVASRKAAG